MELDEFIRMEDDYFSELAELRQTLREIGESEEAIERIVKLSHNPFGTDAREYEDEYPHGRDED